MGTADGYTKAHMKAVEDACIVAGAVDLSGHLQLTRHDGTSFDAGLVKGPPGEMGVAPTGSMFKWGGPLGSAPNGYFPCDGRSLLRTDYPDLFAAIGTKYGSADASHFYLPDNQGFRAKSTSTATLANSTWLTLSGYAADTGYVSKSGRYYTYSGGIWTMVTPGDWDIYTHVFFPNDTVGGRYLVTLWKNNVEVARHDLAVGTRSTPTFLHLAKVEDFVAGDTIETRVYQTTGASLNLGGTSPFHIFELRPRDIGDIIKF